jgi:hypothetical protein
MLATVNTPNSTAHIPSPEATILTVDQQNLQFHYAAHYNPLAIPTQATYSVLISLFL